MNSKSTNLTQNLCCCRHATKKKPQLESWSNFIINSTFVINRKMSELWIGCPNLKNITLLIFCIMVVIFWGARKQNTCWKYNWCLVSFVPRGIYYHKNIHFPLHFAQNDSKWYFSPKVHWKFPLFHIFTFCFRFF